jgi:hypothetical protein
MSVFVKTLTGADLNQFIQFGYYLCTNKILINHYDRSRAKITLSGTYVLHSEHSVMVPIKYLNKDFGSRLFNK